MVRLWGLPVASRGDRDWERDVNDVLIRARGRGTPEDWDQRPERCECTYARPLEYTHQLQGNTPL